MTGEILIGYIETYSKTERALFHKDHLNAFLELAGSEMRVDNEFVACSYDSDLCKLIIQARQNLEWGKAIAKNVGFLTDVD